MLNACKKAGSCDYGAYLIILACSCKENYTLIRTNFDQRGGGWGGRGQQLYGSSRGTVKIGKRNTTHTNLFL